MSVLTCKMYTICVFSVPCNNNNIEIELKLGRNKLGNEDRHCTMVAFASYGVKCSRPVDQLVTWGHSGYSPLLFVSANIMAPVFNHLFNLFYLT